MTPENARLAAALAACHQHANRLRSALDDLRPHMSISSEYLGAADNDTVRTLDQFVYRFGKLQGTAGGQLFPALLAVLQEPMREWSQRDRLNRLEQLRILPSVDAWNRLRAVRNRLAHEYPDAPDRQAAVLNLAWQVAPELLATVEQVARHGQEARSK